MKKNTENTEQAGNTERTEKAENTERTEKTEKTENTERTEKTENTEKTEKAENTERTEKAENTEKADNTEKTEKADNSVSPQAAVSPLQHLSEAPSPSVPSLSDLAIKSCQSLTDMEEADVKAITRFISTLVEDIEKGKLGKRNIKALLHSLHYDRDIATASGEGEIKGRNAKIEELMVERERTANIHMPTGARNNLKSAPPAHVIGGLAAADRRTIWERGNEKRTVY